MIKTLYTSKYVRPFLPVLTLFFTLGLTTGCAPSLGDGMMRISPLNVPYTVQDQLAEQARSKKASVRIAFGRFVDNRNLKAIGEIDGRLLNPATGIESTVRDALSKAFEARGAKVGLNKAVPVIQGAVVRWFLGVTPSFPSTRAEATALISIELSDVHGIVVYRGQYEGGHIERHMLPNKENAEVTLRAAMENAVHSAAEDQNLWSAIRAVS
jgi:hypothetical protein